MRIARVSVSICIFLALASLASCQLLGFSGQVSSNKFYISTDGRPDGDGSIEDPWDAHSGLSNASGRIQPGDTLYIRGGVYDSLLNGYMPHINLKGSKGGSITIKPYNNEKVVFDARNVAPGDTGEERGVTIDGDWLVVRDLHFTNSSGLRGVQGGPLSLNTGVGVFASNSKMINCFIYNNNGVGLGFWKTAVNSEVYGCHVFNNGYYSTGDSPGVAGKIAGHNIYTQNIQGTKTLSDNVVFSSARVGIHVYYTGASAPEGQRVIRGYDILNNILFDNGNWNPEGTYYMNLSLGSPNHPSRDMYIASNIGYQSKNSAEANYTFGYSPDDVINENFTVINNIASGGTVGYLIRHMANINFTNNKVLGPGTKHPVRLVVSNRISTQRYTFSNNAYYRDQWARLMFRNIDVPYPVATGAVTVKELYDGNYLEAPDMASWQRLAGVDQSSVFEAYGSNFHIIYRNAYEAGRAHMVVFNFSGNDSYSFDLSTIIEAGSEYYIYDSQNVIGKPVLKGVYAGGSVNLPMNATMTTRLTGFSEDLPRHTPKQFGAFLVMGRPLDPSHQAGF